MGKESNERERERERLYNELFFERRTSNSLKRSHIGMNYNNKVRRNILHLHLETCDMPSKIIQ